MNDFVTIEKDSVEMHVIRQAFQHWFDNRFRASVWDMDEQGKPYHPISWEEISQTLHRLGLADKIKGQG